METPICLLVNPAAGGGRAARLLPHAEAELRRLGVSFRTVRTRDVSHARDLVREAAAGGETVVLLSGDGLIGAAAEALRPVADATLGILPGGRGNDLARVLGIPTDIEAACAVIAEHETADLDLGLVSVLAGGERSVLAGGERSFIGIASCGFDSEANRIANAAPSWLGGLVYAYGALRALAAWKPARFELTLEGAGRASGAGPVGVAGQARPSSESDEPGAPATTRRSFVGYSVAAANSKAYGGGMFVAPDAELDDGLLDIVVTEHLSKRRFLRLLPKVFRGGHVHEPEVHVLRAAAVTIDADRPFTVYADGDPIGDLPVRVSTIPQAVRMIVPAAYARGQRPPSPGSTAASAAAV